MKMTTVGKLSSVLFLNLTLLSCISRKEVVYFQHNNTSVDTSITSKYVNSRIQTDDILSIHISSLSKEASSFFNVNSEGVDERSEGYLVDDNGNIEIPLVGPINVVGLSTTMAKDTIRKKVEKYLQNPSVTVRYKNFRIIVLGEVAHPGVYVIPNEKMNVVEALGLAGDLTIYGKRENIMVVRDVNGKKEYGYINFNSRKLFESPYYYLRTNDIVYVEPGKGKKSEAENFYRVIPIILSSVTIILVVLSRFF